MNSLKIKVFAKINYSLDICGKQENGYHSLDMLMTSVDIFDVIECNKALQSSVYIDGKICEDRSNTAWKTLELLQKHYCICLEVRITKGIPYSAGMGGSSADASGILWCVSRLYRIPLKKLHSLAMEIGSDCKYMMYGGCVRAQGVGEKIEVVQQNPQNVVVVQTSIGASTRQVYEQFDKNNISYKDNIRSICANFDCNKLYNVLETPAQQLCPEIAIAKDLLSKYSSNVCMTGSGSAYFAIFDTYEQACEVAKALKEKAIFSKAMRTKDNGIEVIVFF